MEKETYLIFKLGQELFAVNVENVLEVLEKQPITPVPRAPAHILGIINFRGEILPVINTHYKFNLVNEIDTVSNIIIVFEVSNGEHRFSIAATANSVKDVIEVTPSEIKPIPEMGVSYDSQFIRGSIRRDDNFILVLNTERTFSISDAESINIL